MFGSIGKIEYAANAVRLMMFSKIRSHAKLYTVSLIVFSGSKSCEQSLEIVDGIAAC